MRLLGIPTLIVYHCEFVSISVRWLGRWITGGFKRTMKKKMSIFVAFSTF